MIERSFDYKVFNEKAEQLLAKETIGFDAERLVSNPDNFLLKSDKDYSLFEYASPGVYTGHYFFSESRGKQALSLANQMLEWFFTNVKDAALITGATPVENKKAKIVNRKLGFKYIQTIPSEVGDLEIYTLTKREFMNNE